MAEIELRDVEKYLRRQLRHPEAQPARSRDNEFVVLLGPSGCGKTTTLRAIAGLEEIDTGDILIDGKPVQHLQAARPRHRLRVPALRALSAPDRLREHRLSAARDAREPRARSTSRCARSPRSLRIEHLLDKRPSALSGGDMQRVAIGRALVRRPKAMLMDEPIGALDAKLREEMRTELKRLHIENGSTTVYVTHDQVEAMALADRIAIMNDGVLQQVGTPDEVYHAPGQPVRRAVRRQPGDERRRRRGRGRRRRHAHGRARRRRRAFDFPGRALPRAHRGAGADGTSSSLGIRPEGVLRRARGAPRLRAGRGAHHRAARRLRHRRPRSRQAVPARAHAERLRARRPATAVWPASTRRRPISSTRARGSSLRVRLG